MKMASWSAPIAGGDKEQYPVGGRAALEYINKKRGKERDIMDIYVGEKRVDLEKKKRKRKIDVS